LVADNWAEYNAMGTLEWIGGMPGGNVRDAATRHLIKEIVTTDPNSAFT